MRGLYAIIDMDALEARRIPVLDFAERVLLARPAALQLRAKRAAPRDTLALLVALGPPCRQAGAWLFANDRPDLARLAGCDGVHVGQTDLAVASVRSVAPGLRVGVSTHDLSQLSAALAERPDYVAFGPVFPTRSKARPDPVVGLDGLEVAARAARDAGVPLVAIGGVDLERAPRIAAIGVAAAVIGALLPDTPSLAGVTERAQALARALRAA
jgi:thiamine-phosphate pyrophosphorylase